MPTVDYSNKAQTDIEAITDWLVAHMDYDTAVKAVSLLLSEVINLAEMPLLAPNVAGLPVEFRMGLVVRKRYRVYFEVLGKQHIKVLRVYGSTRKPLKPGEIK